MLQSNPEDLRRLSVLHGVSYDSTKKMAAKSSLPVTDKDQVIVHSNAYDVQFLNAATPVIEGDKPLNTYNNYIIGNDPSKWKGNCRIYQAITYKNIYPGIDIRYYTSEEKLKYDIIVHPGADLSKLAMKYDGVDALQVKNEQLVIKTPVGETRELAPYAYQVVDGIKKEVGCRFKVSGKVVQFSLNSYSASSVLIIDPTLVFSTFTGSTASNWGYTATYGPDGSFYAGGIVFDVGFKTNPGAYDNTFGGGTSAGGEGLPGYDMGIIKFSPNGANRIYATYLGGSGNEQPHSLVVDEQGELVIAGRTNSTDYPTTANDKPGGNYDIVLTKLNAAGSGLIGSRIIGSTLDDGVNIKPKYPTTSAIVSIRRNYGDDARSEVILDNNGNILLASNTQSPEFPVTPNAFQKTFGGLQDGVIIKTSPDLSKILLSTFLGGSGNDAAFVLAINPSDNNIYVGGNTDSTNMPGDKTNVLYPAYQGGATDGFVSILSPDGGALLKTTYIGTSGIDMLYGIQFDKFSFPYIMGTTTSDNWPVVNAPFSQNKGKQFIAKLKQDLSGYEYSTVFGTGAKQPNISPIAFLVDRCENVYVSGWGGTTDTKGGYASAGTSGLTVTPDAIQSTSDNSDFYFFVLERNATRQLYGSFFGQSGGFGEHVDGGTSRFDRNGVIYQALCANCGRDVSFPTTPGVWSPSNGSSECNLAAVKIAFNLSGVVGSVRASIGGVPRDTSGCVPLTVDFTDTIALGKKYIWNFGDGSDEAVTTDPNISHTFNAVGNYSVRLVSIDSSKCNVADSAYTTIRVRTDKVIMGFTPKKLLPCQSANYEFTNTSYVTPSGRGFTDSSFTWYFGDNTPPVVAGNNVITHSFPSTGVYEVRLVLTDTGFCNAPDSFKISLRIASNLKAQFQIPPTGCAPYNAVFNNISEGGQQFFWDFGDSSLTSTETSPMHLYAAPGTYTIKLRAVDSATCNNVDTTSTTIVVGSKPTASFSYTPNPPKENTAVDFTNSSIGATRYLWQFEEGETLPTTSQANVQHIYNSTGTFNTCLLAANNFGCEDTTCQTIVARITPLIDVPNAFTPNGDGINDKVMVRGFGITKLTWKIYNRWGQLVFETNDRTQGWDGRYKGAIQPKEVYHYVLAAHYSDNTTYEKKGDITLLR